MIEAGGYFTIDSATGSETPKHVANLIKLIKYMSGDQSVACPTCSNLVFLPFKALNLPNSDITCFSLRCLETFSVRFVLASAVISSSTLLQVALESNNMLDITGAETQQQLFRKLNAYL